MFVFVSEAVRPVCLPTRSDVGDSFLGQSTTAVGWGKLSDASFGSSRFPNVVRDRKVIANADCRAFWGGVIIESSVCIDTGEDHAGICLDGDEGGALLVEDDEGRFVQIGITSYASHYEDYTLCEDGSPNICTRVTPFLDWIQYVTGIFIP